MTRRPARAPAAAHLARRCAIAFLLVVVGCGGPHDIVIGTARPGDGGDAGDGASPPRACEGQPEVAAVAVGDDHTCAARADGRLYCWGQNEFGQLGDGTTEARVVPTLVALPGVLQVVTGDDHSCARVGDDVYCWGDNAQGQLGLGDQTARPEPTDAASLPGATLATRLDATCAVDGSGALWCWGSNADGELGQGDSGAGTERSVPTRVGAESDWRSVSVGEAHACGIRADASLWCWGDNANGRLGTGDGDDHAVPTRAGPERGFRQVSAGAWHTCAVSDAGTIWCWGRNGPTDAEGSRFVPDAVGNFNAPVQVGTRSDWVHVHAGKRFTCAVDREDRLHCWGATVPGAGVEQSAIAEPTEFFAPARWRAIATAAQHVCGIRDDGMLQCWGTNGEGQLGVGDQTDRADATTVCLLDD